VPQTGQHRRLRSLEVESHCSAHAAQNMCLSLVSSLTKVAQVGATYEQHVTKAACVSSTRHFCVLQRRRNSPVTCSDMGVVENVNKEAGQRGRAGFQADCPTLVLTVEKRLL
jgi:hypothetical protein